MKIKQRAIKLDHQVPIAGLYAGYDNSVEITMTDQAGKKQVNYLVGLVTFQLKLLSMIKVR